MKMFLLFSMAMLTACAHMAPAPTEPSARKPADESLRHDFTGDGLPETVSITKKENDEKWTAKISIPGRTTSQSITNKAISYAAAWPSMEVLPNGSLKMSFSYEGYTKDSYHYTIAYRNNQFIVAGYTYTYVEQPADPNDSVKVYICDVSLLSGKGVFYEVEGKKKPFVTKQRSIPFSALTDDFRVKECK